MRSKNGNCFDALYLIDFVECDGGAGDDVVAEGEGVVLGLLHPQLGPVVAGRRELPEHVRHQGQESEDHLQNHGFYVFTVFVLTV